MVLVSPPGKGSGAAVQGEQGIVAQSFMGEKGVVAGGRDPAIEHLVEDAVFGCCVVIGWMAGDGSGSRSSCCCGCVVGPLRAIGRGKSRLARCGEGYADEEGDDGKTAFQAGLPLWPTMTCCFVAFDVLALDVFAVAVTSEAHTAVGVPRLPELV